MGVPESSSLSSADESSCTACLGLLRTAIGKLAERCVAATEYEDCVLDLAVPIAALDAALQPQSVEGAASTLLASLFVIEVNTPVYLLATSGRFDLSNAGHVDILCGEQMSDLVRYPVLLAEFAWRTGMIELRT